MSAAKLRMALSPRRFVSALIWICVVALLAFANASSAQVLTNNALVAALRQGGYVIVIRHASSPTTLPSKQTADPGNLKLERQLDEAGRAGATTLGRRLKELNVPIGEVVTSPMFRATETARLAQLTNATIQAELGENGEGMQPISEAQANWLKDRVKHLPKESNTVLVTHNPNLTKAFPSWGATVTHGEAVVLDLDSKGATRVVGRIKVEEWPRLR